MSLFLLGICIGVLLHKFWYVIKPFLTEEYKAYKKRKELKNGG